MTGGGFELKETKVQAGVGVGAEILSSGVFISRESGLDRIVVEPRGDLGALLMVQASAHVSHSGDYSLNLKASELPDYRESI